MEATDIFSSVVVAWDRERRPVRIVREVRDEMGFPVRKGAEPYCCACLEQNIYMIYYII